MKLRQSVNVQRSIDSLGYWQQRPAHGARLTRRVGEDKAVVLIGSERLLMTPLAAERYPAHPRGVDASGFQFKLDDTSGQQVIKCGDNLGEVLRVDALGQ